MPKLLLQAALLRINGIDQMTDAVTAVAQMYRKYQHDSNSEDCEDESEPGHFNKACVNP